MAHCSATEMRRFHTDKIRIREGFCIRYNLKAKKTYRLHLRRKNRQNASDGCNAHIQHKENIKSISKLIPDVCYDVEVAASQLPEGERIQI